MELIDRALANGVRVRAWTIDEGYGRDTPYLDGLEQRGQVFVGEVPTSFRGWMKKPHDRRFSHFFRNASLRKSHIRIVESSLPVISVAPSSEKANVAGPSCAWNRAISLPVATSYT